MPKQNQAVEAKSDKRSWPKVKPTVVEEWTDDLAGLAKLPGGPIAAIGDGSIQAQAALLGDKRLQSVQRRTLAAQIGRAQGNRHLQRVIASVKGEAKTAPYPSHTSKPLTGSAGDTVMEKSARSARPAVVRKADAAEAIGEAVLEEGLGSSGPPTMAVGEPPPSDGRTSAVGGEFIEAQATRFGDEQPPSAQRRAPAAQIGRVGGNQYLQRVMVRMRGDEQAADANTVRDDGMIIQREARFLPPQREHTRPVRILFRQVPRPTQEDQVGTLIGQIEGDLGRLSSFVRDQILIGIRRDLQESLRTFLARTTATGDTLPDFEISLLWAEDRLSVREARLGRAAGESVAAAAAEQAGAAAPPEEQEAAPEVPAEAEPGPGAETGGEVTVPEERPSGPAMGLPVSPEALQGPPEQAPRGETIPPGMRRSHRMRRPQRRKRRGE
jgi:hypothetical protein